MTFGEHLEELRVSLWKAMIGVVVGALLGFTVASSVVEYIQTPLKNALGDYYLTSAIEDIKEKNNGEITPEQITLIEEEHVAPDIMFLSTESVIDQFAQAYPDQFKDGGFNPYRFTADDISPEFALSFVQSVLAAKTPAAQALDTALTLEGKKSLEAITKLNMEQAGSMENRQLIANALNGTLFNKELYKTEAMQKLTYPHKEWKTTIDQLYEELKGEAAPGRLPRLNRLLISAAFPKAIGKPRDAVLRIASWKPVQTKLQALGAQEAFMIWLKASFITGIMIASPWIFWQIWHFVAAGLYPHEQNYVYIYLPFSLGLFIAGAALAFNFVFEPVLTFLFSFNRAMNIDPDPRISEWLSFVLFLPLGFGISFQLPLVMLFLNRIGILSLETFISQWRMAILVIFVVSMFLTPADPISMLLMAVPLTILYFGGILLCKYMPRGRNPFDEVYEP